LAVKVAVLPRHIVVEGVEMVTHGVTGAPTDMFIVLLVTCTPFVHDAFEVILHVTAAPLVKVVVV
jgi:hypothetical protein